MGWEYEPANTACAGPVMKSRPSDSRHSISRSPPGSVTTHVRSEVFPARMAATTSAHAPVPHARVAPAPRSHTFITKWVGVRTSTNSVLTFAGNAGWASKAGPTAAKSRSSILSTNTTACGLPMDTHVTFQSTPFTDRGASTTFPPSMVGSSVVGTCAPSRMGNPMSTVTRPSARITGLMGPAPVSIVYFTSPACDPSRFARYFAMQRIPFPHISGSEPSEL
mmetsp:Transcript_32944/g.65635  ORF Transcript_32944/g.65635 Transcript_32944/m.65635 type:complete len:222 (+) Transcript_32944:319-984(+)